jgi:hypothetical protein
MPRVENDRLEIIDRLIAQQAYQSVSGWGGIAERTISPLSAEERST